MFLRCVLGRCVRQILARIPMLIAGAWIGGTVNNTGNVVAAAAILQNDEAEEVAAIVKMLQVRAECPPPPRHSCT